MTGDQIIAALQSGESVEAVFTSEGNLENLVKSWEYQGKYILTWEQCPPGEQYNENRYTRDERHVFVTAREVVEFMSEQKLEFGVFSVAL